MLLRFERRRLPNGSINLPLNPHSFPASASGFSVVPQQQKRRLAAAKETVTSAAKSALTPAKTVQGGAVTTAVSRIRATHTHTHAIFLHQLSHINVHESGVVGHR